MTDSKHTPGPWKFEKEWGGYPLIAQVSKFVRAIYVVSPSSEADPTSDAEANARLIAAAPELLAALKGLLDEVDVLDARLSSPAYEAQKAIAKAEGRS